MSVTRRTSSSKYPSDSRDSSIWVIDKAFYIVLSFRCISAVFNIIHDCDEVFNYWEPLHYVLYGYGQQTWEYSAEFALRSWWYILIHYVLGYPVKLIAGEHAGKVAVFYWIRLVLACSTGVLEWLLYKAISRYSRIVGRLYVLLTCFSTGMFVSASAFLPSSFAMGAMTAAAAGVLCQSHCSVVFASVIGSVWGWVVASLGFVPYALWVLFTCPRVKSFRCLGIGLVVSLVPLVYVDKLYYGSWKASLLNFLEYNVSGGGKSDLYGVEPASYYLRNGLNQLQFVLPLALAFPLIVTIASQIPIVKDGATRIFIAISPAFVWFTAITLLPHKEERFLYVVYPLITLAAAVMLAYTKQVLTSMEIPKSLVNTGLLFFLFGTCMLAVSRTLALTLHYGAPMQLFRHLPAGGAENAGLSSKVYVCMGSEWYRYPSSFFLPGPEYRLQFVKSGFDGLLPRPFEENANGTMVAPKQFNDMNREESDNYWAEPSRCDFFVTMSLDGSWIDNGLIQQSADAEVPQWQEIRSIPFVDGAKSPALTRAFFIPTLSHRKNHWARFVLLQKVRS